MTDATLTHGSGPGSALRGLSSVNDLLTTIEERSALDAAVDRLASIASPRLGTDEARRLLGGRWLGHSIHPLLTDLPIGCWTSATVLDLVGGKRSAPAATGLVALGVLTALPTVITGLSDWLVVDRRSQRIGVVHAAANGVALGFFLASLVARVRGRRAKGIVLGLLGGTAATVGGLLGGHLTITRGVGVDASRDALSR